MRALVIGAAILAAAVIGTAGWSVLPSIESLASRAGGGDDELSLAFPDTPPDAGPLGHGDGFIADGDSISPFAGDHPAIANLDPELRAAFQTAAQRAERDGVVIRVTSGWRSTRYQQALLDEAIATYGSEQEAQRWVNTPELSTHVTGNAVDIGPTEASDWLSRYGANYGLCQVYANEMWHFELLTKPGGVCPPQLSDATGGGPGQPRDEPPGHQGPGARTR